MISSLLRFFKFRSYDYISSLYNTVVKCDEGWLIHNQMSGSILLLDEEKKKEYDSIVQGNFLNVSSNFLNILFENKYIIKSTIDEKKILADAWETSTNGTDFKGITIVTTDRCNLGCNYCYQKKEDWMVMNDETQKDLEKFIEVYLTATPTKHFAITWFGGEPTLNMSCIERISSFIESFCKKKNIEWSPWMITNGTTLTKHVVNRLLKCKIKGLQITLDGIKEDHDAKRPYLSSMLEEEMNEYQIKQRKKINPNLSLSIIGQQKINSTPKSSFNDIIKNIQNCLDEGIFVSLRVNVDKINKNNVEKLYKMADHLGWNKKNEKGGIVKIYTHGIFDGCTGETADQMTQKEYADFEISINQKFNSVDGYKKLLRFTGDTCTANKNFNFVINPSGQIVKCWHHSGDDSHSIGTIKDLNLARFGTAAKDKYKFNPLKDPECYNCSVLPICFGGCKVNNQFDTKGYEGKHDLGCMTSRYALPQEILHSYKMKKSKT